MSAPEQNATPAPVITTAHTAVFARGAERLGERDPELAVDRILAMRSVKRQRPNTVAVTAQQRGFLRHQG
jgi:hypothetical protein